MGNLGKGIGAIAGGALGGPLGGAVGGFLGGLFDGTEDAPQWQDVQFQGMNADDSRLYFNPGANAYGQDVARENMSRYGFQGVYQKFLQGESQRMKDDEGQRIMRMASSLTPGSASLRSGLASQGMGGATSNVLANQQRSSLIGKALDTGFNALEQSNARIDSAYLGMTADSEKLRFGASQDLMRGIGQQSEVGKFNAGVYGDISKFNTQGQWDATKTNAMGRMGQANAQYETRQEFNNSLMTGFAGVAGGMLGKGMGFSDPFGIQKTVGGWFSSSPAAQTVRNQPQDEIDFR